MAKDINLPKAQTESKGQESISSKLLESIDITSDSYLTQLTNEALNKLPSLNKTSYTIDPITDEKIFTIGTGQITLKNIDNLSVNTHKTLIKTLTVLTAENSLENLKSKNVNYRVVLNIEEMAKERGILTKKDLEDSKKKSQKLKNFRRQLKKDMDILTERLIFDDGINYINISVLATGKIINRGKILYITVNPDYADSIINQNLLTKYPKALYKIDARDKNSYALGVGLNNHFSKYANQTTDKKTKKQPTYDRLKVSTCLSYLPNILSYKDVLSQSGSWKYEIKEKLENCLEVLVKAGHLQEWHYGLEKGKFLKSEDLDKYINDYESWCNLRVYFTPCNYWELMQDEKLVRKKEKELENLNLMFEI